MMTPEEIQQVVEDYRKSNSLNEIFNDKTKNFLRNFGRQNKDKVNGNGAQGATNVHKVLNLPLQLVLKVHNLMIV